MIRNLSTAILRGYSYPTFTRITQAKPQTHYLIYKNVFSFSGKG